MIQEVVEQIENTVASVINNSVHTALPAEVTLYDPATGMVNVKPIGSFYCEGVELPYPEITSVPVLSPNTGGNVSVCGPIRSGDTCLLIISEQSLSAWLTGTSQTQKDEKFELQNAIAIMGLHRTPLPEQVEANRNGSYIIRSGKTKLTIAPDGVYITGSLHVSGSITSNN